MSTSSSWRTASRPTSSPSVFSKGLSMKRELRRGPFGLKLLSLLLLPACVVLLRAPVPTRIDFASQPQTVELYGRLPLSFERNEGQSDPNVKFLSRANGYTLFLTSQEAVLSLATGERADESAVLRMK